MKTKSTNSPLSPYGALARNNATMRLYHSHSSPDAPWWLLLIAPSTCWWIIVRHTAAHWRSKRSRLFTASRSSAFRTFGWSTFRPTARQRYNHLTRASFIQWRPGTASGTCSGSWLRRCWTRVASKISLDWSQTFARAFYALRRSGRVSLHPSSVPVGREPTSCRWRWTVAMTWSRSSKLSAFKAPQRCDYWSLRCLTVTRT